MKKTYGEISRATTKHVVGSEKYAAADEKYAAADEKWDFYTMSHFSL